MGIQISYCTSIKVCVYKGAFLHRKPVSGQRVIIIFSNYFFCFRTADQLFINDNILTMIKSGSNGIWFGAVGKYLIMNIETLLQT